MIKKSPKKQKQVKVKTQKQKVKTVLIILGVMFALIICGSIVDSLDINWDGIKAKIVNSKIQDSEEEKSKEGQKYLFAVADYDEDIMQDEKYLDKTRYVKYTEGGISTYISNGNYSDYGDCIEMLGNYFADIIEGDADTYNTYFSPDYTGKTYYREAFTMQRLYDISVELISNEITNPGESGEYTTYKYLVEYKIMKNNGTFRYDMGSDMMLPEIYTMIVKTNSNDEIKINSIENAK